MTYTIKSLKSFIGIEGHGFNVVLCRDSKPVAFVCDDASGGEISFDWYDNKEAPVVINGINYLNAPYSYNGTPEEKIFMEYVSTLTRWCDYEKKDVVMTGDVFVSNIIEKFEQEKQMKRWCKTKVVFRTPDMKEGEYHTIKGIYDERIKAHIASKYPTAIIMNEQFA